MKIAIVIPAYNEEQQIKETLKSLKKLQLSTVVVDDGSKDKTYSMAKSNADHLLRHRVNLGKGAAMKTGAEYAFDKGFEAIIFFDGDGQHSPNDITKFTDKLNEGYDLVLGTRNYSYDVPLIRYVGNKFASVLVSMLFGIYASDLICGLRGLNKKAFNKLYWESTGYGVETEMVIRASKVKLKVTEVPVQTIYHDKVKGVTLLDAFAILFQVAKWRIKL